jgi:hypothetical protein
MEACATAFVYRLAVPVCVRPAPTVCFAQRVRLSHLVTATTASVQRLAVVRTKGVRLRLCVLTWATETPCAAATASLLGKLLRVTVTFAWRIPTLLALLAALPVAVTA